MTPIVEIFRLCLPGWSRGVNLPDLAYSFRVHVVVVIIGTVIFTGVEATFMDTV